MKLVIITACQAGVAHSKMCAAGLKKEAEARGHKVVVEVQGGNNLTTALSKEVCQSADIIFIANCIAVAGADRFVGKPVIKIPIDKAIRNIKLCIDKCEEVYKQSVPEK